MTAFDPQLALMIVGILAALVCFAAFSDIRKKALLIQGLFFLAIAAQIATQALQYLNFNRLRGEQEHRTAAQLYAYTENNLDQLKRVAQDDPFIVAYRYFQDKDYKDAKPYFERSIQEGKFVAQSHYLLAHILRQESPDWTEAEKHLDAAIEYDNTYAAAYYGRAIMRLQANQISGALDDLKRSAMLSATSCDDVNDPPEIMIVWARVKDDERFQKIQQECREKHKPAAK
ncbi:MAG: hypothetical protein WBP79_11860 [Candidatus Acidiferrales bacterium]